MRISDHQPHPPFGNRVRPAHPAKHPVNSNKAVSRSSIHSKGRFLCPDAGKGAVMSRCRFVVFSHQTRVPLLLKRGP